MWKQCINLPGKSLRGAHGATTIVLFLFLLTFITVNALADCVPSPNPDGAGNYFCTSTASNATDNCAGSSVTTYSCTSGLTCPTNDAISTTYFTAFAENLSIGPSATTPLGTANTEAAYVVCKISNDNLQSCMYSYSGDNFTTSTTPTFADTRTQATVGTVLQTYTDGSGTVHPVFCPLIKANVMSNDINAVITYNGIQYPVAPIVGGDAVTIPGLPVLGGIGNLVALQMGAVENQSVCLVVLTPRGYVSLACKSPPAPPTPVVPVPPSAGTACSDGSVNHSLAFFSVTGRVIECIRSTLDSVFCTSACQTAQNTVNLMQNLQNGMQSIIQAALILYVIIFGIRTATSKEMPQKGEVLMALAKMILVVYFSVGYNINGYNSNGTIDYLYPLLKAAMNSFSNFIFQASEATLCNYPPKNYSYDAGYSYLALWDSVDCRLGFYLGFYGIFGPPLDILYGIIALIFPLLLGMKFLFMVFLVCFGIFLLSITVYFVHVFILALIGLTIMIYLAPIYVPMALFEQTKSYFESWLHLLFSYTLQPAIITAFLAIMLCVFDGIMFQDCTFSSEGATFHGMPYWTVTGSVSEGPNTISQTCQDSFGYLLNNASNNLTTTWTAFFSLTTIDFPEWGAFFIALLHALLFSIIFYFFSETVGSFAAELTGGSDLSKFATKPTAIADAAASKAKQKLTTRKKPGAKDPGVKGVEAHNG